MSARDMSLADVMKKEDKEGEREYACTVVYKINYSSTPMYYGTAFLY